jgi:hypothetical protein
MASPALQAREREIFARWTASLADLIAAETAAEPDDLRPSIVAQALIGAHQSLIGFARARLLGAPDRAADLAETITVRGRQAFDLLEQGLAGYGAKPA